MKTAKVILLIFFLTIATTSLWAQQTDHIEIRKQAQKAFQDGNWKEAYQLYRQLCLQVTNDSKMVGNDLRQAWQCLGNLNRLSELDGFREEVIEKYFDNWRLLRSAATSYSQNNHRGYMVAGEFHRGDHRGGGRYVNAVQRDRVRALQLMNRALELTAAEPIRNEVADFTLEFAGIIVQYSGYQQAWRLQYLTDLNTLPDYEPGPGYEYRRSTQGAPGRSGRPAGISQHSGDLRIGKIRRSTLALAAGQCRRVEPQPRIPSKIYLRILSSPAIRSTDLISIWSLFCPGSGGIEYRFESKRIKSV